MDRKTIMSALAMCVAGIGSAADVITYEQFGAKGDGRTDDLPAIVAAHKAANEKNLPVRARNGATYYIGGRGLTARVRTDTDFGTAAFIIDDRDVSNCNARVFVVESTERHSPLTGVKKLMRGIANVGVTLPRRSLVVFEDKTRRQFRRTGNVNMTTNGDLQMEHLIVNADGSLDGCTPVVQDMAEVAKATAYPIDAKPLTVRGGTFTTLATREIAALWHKWNVYQRGILVARSNVLLADIRHDVAGQVDGICPYAGFVKIEHATDVMVSNCVFFAHRKTTHGTYDVVVGHSVNVSFLDCREATDILDAKNWPGFGSSYCRNLTFDRCSFARFDAHCGVCDATIRRSRLRQINAVGWGTLRVENTRVEGGVFCWYRGDYGSNWDGDFIVKNSTWAPHGGSGVALILAQNDGNHDYGYPCHMARRIVVDGLAILDMKDGSPVPVTLFVKNPTELAEKGAFAYLPPEEICLRNITLTSGNKPTLTNDGAFFRPVRFTGNAEVAR